MKKLKYVEFLAFIGRVSGEIYRHISRYDYPLHLQINEMLPVLLKTASLKPIFEFPKEDYEEYQHKH